MRHDRYAYLPELTEPSLGRRPTLLKINAVTDESEEGIVGSVASNMRLL